jgi:kynurenine formamidase
MTHTGSHDRLTYSLSDVETIARRHRTWGRWGRDDDLGHVNYLTENRVRDAARLIRRGVTFSLAIPLDRAGPQNGRSWRISPQHLMLRDGGDILAADDTRRSGFESTDDAVYLPLQAGTQWDAFCHVFYGQQTYNGRGPETVTSLGARANSIAAMAERMVGRGVLLDIARFFGCDYLEPGTVIQDYDLSACAAAQHVEVCEGDIVVIRTGHLARRRTEPGWGDYSGGPAPGLGVSASEFLCPRHVAAVAGDTWGLEVIPSECPDLAHPLHVVLLVNAGVLIGEIWDVEALAADCARDGVYEFFLTAQPMTVTGAVGSSINPVAIK